MGTGFTQSGFVNSGGCILSSAAMSRYLVSSSKGQF